MIDEHNFAKYTDYWVKSKMVAKVVLSHKPKFVLDVGCGEGKVVKILRNRGVSAIGIDIENNRKYAPEYCFTCDAKKINFPDNYFDVVVSNDFFEHIPEQDIDQVYSEMKRVGRHIIARISLKQKDNHLTVKPISWWKEKLPGCEFIGKDWNK